MQSSVSYQFPNFFNITKCGIFLLAQLQNLMLYLFLSRLNHSSLVHFLVISSIENAKQKMEHDMIIKDAEMKKYLKRQELILLRHEFQALLQLNNELPKHMQLARAVCLGFFPLTGGLKPWLVQCF